MTLYASKIDCIHAAFFGPVATQRAIAAHSPVHTNIHTRTFIHQQGLSTVQGNSQMAQEQFQGSVSCSGTSRHLARRGGGFNQTPLGCQTTRSAS